MAVPTAAYLVIVLGILVLGWGLATLIYFILRRRNIIPSLFASSSPDFVRPAARPARFGFGGSFFSGGSPMGSGGGRGGIVGGGAAPWQQFTQEWKPVLGEIPTLEERVLEEEGGQEEEEWKPLNAQIQASPSHPPSLILSFLLALPSQPDSSTSNSESLTDLEFATVSVPLSQPSFAQLLPLATPLESLGPLEKVVNGVRMRREWVQAGARGGRTRQGGSGLVYL